MDKIIDDLIMIQKKDKRGFSLSFFAAESGKPRYIAVSQPLYSDVDHWSEYPLTT